MTEREPNYVWAVFALVGSYIGVFIGVLALNDAVRNIARGKPAIVALNEITWPLIYLGFMISAGCVSYLGITITRIIRRLNSIPRGEK